MSKDAERRRDPARRRRESVVEAAELVPEFGSAGLSHRKVAAGAGVPLGPTTQPSISGATWQAALTGEAPSVVTLQRGLTSLFDLDREHGR